VKRGGRAGVSEKSRAGSLRSQKARRFGEPGHGRDRRDDRNGRDGPPGGRPLPHVPHPIPFFTAPTSGALPVQNQGFPPFAGNGDVAPPVRKRGRCRKGREGVNGGAADPTSGSLPIRADAFRGEAGKGVVGQGVARRARASGSGRSREAGVGRARRASRGMASERSKGPTRVRRRAARWPPGPRAAPMSWARVRT